jgi:hypothetical protein
MMESLALIVVAMILCVVFFAAFSGFIVGDNVESKALIIVIGGLPAIGAAFLIGNWAIFLLWVASYICGFIVGRILQ